MRIETHRDAFRIELKGRESNLTIMELMGFYMLTQKRLLIPHIPHVPEDNAFHFDMKRKQFPVKAAFAMTATKS